IPVAQPSSASTLAAPSSVAPSGTPLAPSSASMVASSGALPPPPPTSGALRATSVVSGLLSRTSLRDLLVVLAGERRTGTVTVTTTQGAGELRLHDGDIVDAVYLRLEGTKAVARLLGERDGTFSFLPRTPPVMRRINVPVQALLEKCEAQIEAARAARASVA